MGVYVIATKDGKFFELDCTENFSMNSQGQPTRYQLQSGKTATDHYTVSNETLSIDGVITDAKIISANSNIKSTDDFMTGLKALQKSKQPFKVFYRNSTTGGSRFLDNCLFTNLTFSQDRQFGVYKDLYAYKVQLAVESIRFSDRAKITQERVNGSATTANPSGDKLADKSSATTTKDTPPKDVGKAGDTDQNPLKEQLDKFKTNVILAREKGLSSLGN